MLGSPSLRTLSSLRFIAAYFVFAYHLIPMAMGLRYASLPPFFTRLLECACVGVPFFFALSGFVLYHAYRTRIPRGATEIRAFFWRRFARLAPFLYFSLLLGFTTYAAGSAGTARISIYGFLNFTFLSAWFPPSLAFNYPSWSVSVEAACYILFPFLLPVVVKLTRAQAGGTVALAFAAGASVQLAGIALFPDLRLWPWVPGTVAPAVAEFFSVNPLAHFPSFLFGLALARFHELSPPATGRRGDLLLLGGSIALLALLLLGPRWPFVMVTSFLFLPLHAVLLLGGAGPRGPGLRWLEAPWAVLLGDSSYVLYLLHVPLYGLWHAALPGAPPWLTGAGFLLGLPLLSVFLHLRLEAPARDFLNRRFTLAAA